MVLMRTAGFSFALWLLLSSVCRPEVESDLSREADSLIFLTLELQQTISSPDIQRLSEFQNEIIRDLNLIETRRPGLAGELSERGPNILDQYLQLNQDLEYCLQACSQYHEEAYMLETTLAEIKEQLGQNGSDKEILRKMIQGEWMVYTDLALRIDSSIRNLELHSKVYYDLKPAIDSMMIRKGKLPHT